jgi:hypothetical protein
VTPEEVYSCWAPEGVLWSRWAKPVVFAHLHLLTSQTSQALTPGDPSALSAAAQTIEADRATAVVIDLPGASGVEMGLALAAARGYRPVPLYNAVPLPVLGSGAATHAQVMVDLRGVASFLQSSACALAETPLPPDAPPAFLLDSRRRVGDSPVPVAPGSFDNRSVSLPSDFPSATTLQVAGIARVIVVVPADQHAPQNDLSHTLRRWQDGGISILLLRLGADAGAEAIDVPRPRWYRHAWHALLVRLGLRRHVLGGFGGFLPEPSSG